MLPDAHGSRRFGTCVLVPPWCCHTYLLLLGVYAVYAGVTFSLTLCNYASMQCRHGGIKLGEASLAGMLSELRGLLPSSKQSVVADLPQSRDAVGFGRQLKFNYQC